MSNSPALSPPRGPVPLCPTAPGVERVVPRPLTSFVGREREVAALRALLGRGDVRLVTLCGPGGVRKTRLVQRVAEDLTGFPGGSWFVDLAPGGTNPPGAPCASRGPWRYWAALGMEWTEEA